MPFGEYELGVKGNAPADGEIVYEMDELPPEDGDETGFTDNGLR